MRHLWILLLFGCAHQAPLQYFAANNDFVDVDVQVPLSPLESTERLIVPEGFSARLYAAEPDIVNPIALTWDERGRLWVVESTNYPHDHVGEESGTDRITICEDTDGDGRADHFIRFAENQPLTTAIAIVKGGAIVGQAPDIVFLEDTDGDDRFDQKHVVIDDAFGTYDTHAVMNNFKVGIDNHIWSAVGYSGMYRPGEAPNAEARILGRGVFRFSRDGTVLDAVGEFNNNTWGLGIGEDNTIFGSTANNNHAVVVGIPMRYEAEQNVANVQSHYLVLHSSERQLQQVDFRDGYTAAAGAFVYAGRRYPVKYHGALLVTEPTAHVLHPAFLEADGSIYREVEGAVENLLASSDEWVAPVFADIGPDEQVWVADWYNPVIQHNPDRRGMVNQIWSPLVGPGNAHLNPLRDREHGRVYVIDYEGRAADDIRSLSPDDPEGLLRGLRSTNQFWRLTAQRLIIENGLTGLADELIELSREDHLGAVHALWALHGLDLVETAMADVQAALTHSHAAVRKAAAMVLPSIEETGEALVRSGILTDSNLNTRLAAVLKVIDLAGNRTPEVAAAAEAARDGADSWIIAALDKLSPLVAEAPVEEEPMPDMDVLPPARLELTAPTGIMRFAEAELQAFEGQPIRLVFTNLHPDLHNAVFLQPNTDVPAFGQALDLYMVDPAAIDNEYVPPSEAEHVVATTGVLSQDETITIEIPPLLAGDYPFLCSVPGHWAAMQGVLSVRAAPEMPRNDAAWAWESSEPLAAGDIVYLAGSMGRERQSHYHARVFGFADGQVLYGAGDRTYHYTESSGEGFPELVQGADLLVLSNNKPVASEAAREAVFAHADAGRPLLITHPASWYNWADWEAYNRELVGGGSRSHEPLGGFTVEVIQPQHPVMQGAPASFDITDELYRAELLPEAEASILAIGRSKTTGMVYPVIWTLRRGNAVIMVNTLGHDDRAHNLEPYKRILANARSWLLDQAP